MILCRGRNGWFSFSDHVAVRGTFRPSKKGFNVNKDNSSVISVGIVSRTIPNHPPICIEGGKQEMKRLFSKIAREISKL